jgi:hypothetical protein
MRKILVILSLLLFVASCKNNEATKSDNILINNPKYMANLLFDIHLAEGMETCKYITSNESKYIYSKILQKYKATPADFDSAIVYYANHNSSHKMVYDLVSKKMDDYIKLCDQKFFGRYPANNTNYWKDYAIFPNGLYKMTQFLPFYICPKPEYLNKPLIIEK